MITMEEIVEEGEGPEDTKDEEKLSIQNLKKQLIYVKADSLPDEREDRLDINTGLFHIPFFNVMEIIALDLSS